jgi:3-oxoacyl-[acyl-carrier protein] reductase
MELEGKVVVITGGSRGIGKAIAVLFAEKGARIVICARNVEDLRKTSDQLTASGGSCHHFVTDVRVESDVAALAAGVVREFGRVDILVNNAGVGTFKPLLNTTIEDWDAVIDTNLRGPFLCVKAFAPIMIGQRNGCIVNIISGAGKKAMENLSIYCASKFGLLGLTKSVEKEFKAYGLRVVYLCPGFVKTSFFENFPVHFRVPSDAQEPHAIAQEVLRIVKGNCRKAKIRSLIGRMLVKL